MVTTGSQLKNIDPAWQMIDRLSIDNRISLDNDKKL